MCSSPGERSAARAVAATRAVHLAGRVKWTSRTAQCTYSWHPRAVVMHRRSGAVHSAKRAPGSRRHGLVVGGIVGTAHGRAEVEQALVLLGGLPEAGAKPRTVGADKGYDTRAFVEGARALDVTPHVAPNAKQSAIDGRTTRHAGYAVSQRKRKPVEEVFGWGKTVGLLRKLRHRGGPLVDWVFTFTYPAYNLRAPAWPAVSPTSRDTWG